jgi:hypothetical protein
VRWSVDPGREFILFLGALLVSNCVAAQSEWTRGWYAGGGISANNVFAVEGSGYVETSERGSSATGFSVDGGYRSTRHLAFELGYLDGGAPEFHTIAAQSGGPAGLYLADIAQKTTAIEASVVAIVPFRNIWEFFMRGGAAFWDASSDQVLTPLTTGAPIVRRVDANGADFVLGIGAGIAIGTNMHARLEYQAFRTRDDLLALDANREARFDRLGLELQWRFGHR